MAGVFGALSFFEPCTIATHTLFAVRTHHAPAKQRWLSLMQLALSRILLLVTLFTSAAAIGLGAFSSRIAALMLGVAGLVYLGSRTIYLPVPHLAFFRLMPWHTKLPQGYKLGLTLPACTLPLVAITGMASALAQRPGIAALAGLIFATLFTLPTIWDSTRKLDAAHRIFLGTAATLSPYITTLLLWSGAFLIWQTEI